MSILLVEDCYTLQRAIQQQAHWVPAAMQKLVLQNENLRLMSEIVQCFSRKKYYQSKFFYGLMLRSICKIKSAAWQGVNRMSWVCRRLFGAQVVGSVSGCWVGAKQCISWWSLLVTVLLTAVQNPRLWGIRKTFSRIYVQNQYYRFSWHWWLGSGRSDWGALVKQYSLNIVKTCIFKASFSL